DVARYGRRTLSIWLTASADGAGASGRVPRGESAADVPRVEAALTQRYGDVASDLEAVGTVDEHWRVGRELGVPVVHPFRVAPDCGRHRIGVPGDVVPRPCIHHLEPLIAPHHGAELLDGDGG